MWFLSSFSRGVNLFVAIEEKLLRVLSNLVIVDARRFLSVLLNLLFAAVAS